MSLLLSLSSPSGAAETVHLYARPHLLSVCLSVQNCYDTYRHVSWRELILKITT